MYPRLEDPRNTRNARQGIFSSSSVSMSAFVSSEILCFLQAFHKLPIVALALEFGLAITQCTILNHVLGKAFRTMHIYYPRSRFTQTEIADSQVIGENSGGL